MTSTARRLGTKPAPPATSCPLSPGSFWSLPLMRDSDTRPLFNKGKAARKRAGGDRLSRRGTERMTHATSMTLPIAALAAVALAAIAAALLLWLRLRAAAPPPPAPVAASARDDDETL